MAKLEQLIAAHPIRGLPYDMLEFVCFDRQRVPLYKVKGTDGTATGAPEALRKAFARYGGKCFYCRRRFKPQPLSNDAHRDHVIPKKSGGSNLLHNLVIACAKCDSTKGCKPVHDFSAPSAQKYLSALNLHIRRCINDATPPPPKPSGPPPPKRDAAADP